MGAYWVDIAAVAFFVVEWLAYGSRSSTRPMAATACRRA